MNNTWIILSLIAPLFWALSNIFDKYALNKLSKSTSDFIFFGTIGGFLIGLIGFFTLNIEPLSTDLLIMAVAGGFLLNYAYIFYAKALEKNEMTTVTPIFQTIPIFVLLFGFTFFKKKLN